MAPIQRQSAAPVVSPRKPNQDGNNQNHSARNEAPTASEAMVVGQCAPGFVVCEAPDCPLAINSSIAPKYEPNKLAIKFHVGLLIGITDGSGSRLHSFLLGNSTFPVSAFIKHLVQRWIPNLPSLKA
jgi:hypothetical protein